ncbi:hypothetical protein QYM36_019859 [Artemia franciscana]|uniref:Uncharacterized protein n=1 Tax=Artemia franciscana TaxID=6661 RepID=A0AA88KYZ7_ARTSF|nr:hypothetical protein QYM36_019859 [Artemia franciscana]
MEKISGYSKILCWSDAAGSVFWIVQVSNLKWKALFSVVIVLMTIVLGLSYVFLSLLVFGVSLIFTLKGIKQLQRYGNQRRRGITRSKDQGEIKRELQGKLFSRAMPKSFWNEVQVSSCIDSALDSLFERIIEKFILSWEKVLGDDTSFSTEARLAICCLTGNLYRRLSKIDPEKFIRSRAIPVIMAHIDNWIKSNTCLGKWKNITSEEAAILFYGEDLHPALKSRESELVYLRSVIEKAMLSDLNKNYLESREILVRSVLMPALDIAAEPVNLNALILLLLGNKSLELPETSSHNVNLLEAFHLRGGVNRSEIYALSLKELRSDIKYNELLRNVLKREDADIFLNFCDSIDDVNDMLMNADLNESHLVMVHKMVTEIYNRCFSQDGANFINLPPETVKEIKEIVEGVPKDVVKLRQNRAWFLSYEHVYGILENQLVPRFIDSPEYLSFFLGKKQLISQENRNVNLKAEGVSINRIIGQKIKGVLRASSPVEGELLGDEEIVGQELTESSDFGEDINTFSDNGFSPLNVQPNRDLSSWRVSIPRIIRRSSESRRNYFVYVIDVQRVDLKYEDALDNFRWTVEREYSEFYNLEDQLTKFHGILHDVRLPPKKIFGFRNHEFLESKRPIMESYLRSLLLVPTLKGSDSIFSFLTLVDNLHADNGSPVVPDLGLGRIIKNVPAKFRGEKGQCLEPFLINYTASIEPIKPRPSRLDVREANLEEHLPPRKDVKHSSFGNNAYEIRASWDLTDVIKLKPANRISLRGFFDAFLHLCVRCFQFMDWQLSLLLGVQTVLSDIIDKQLSFWISNRLEQLLAPEKVGYLITLINESIFGQASGSLADEKKSETVMNIKLKILDYVPSLLLKVCGTESLEEGIASIIDLIQKPLLNKHLVYMLFDQIIEELFPELFEKPVTTYHVRTHSSDFRL